MKKTLAFSAIAIVLACFGGGATAQTAALPYGAPITLEQARKVLAAAEAESRKINVPSSVAILDSGGHLVLLQRMDGSQFAGAEVAVDKAFSAIAYKRPGKAFEDRIAMGGAEIRILRLRGASPIDGGEPIVIDGKLVGSIGVSGGTGAQDGQIARAGVSAAK